MNDMTDAPLPDDERPLPEELHDPVLWRALEHAPDRAVMPDHRLGKAIRRLAREEMVPLGAPVRQGAQPKPWWQRLLGGGAMPWNAAFATVLVGVLVTVMWQRQPVPGARSDGDDMKASAPASSGPATAAAPPPPPVADVPPPSSAAVEPPPAATATAPPPSAEPERRQTAPAAAPVPSTAAPPPAVAQQAPSIVLVTPPPPERPAPLARAEAPVASAAPRERQAAEAKAAPPAAADKAFTERRATLADRNFVPALPPAPSAAAPAGAPPVAASGRIESGEPPTFSALAQWTRMTVTQGGGGASRSLPRAEARDLGNLVGSAALSAGAPQSLPGAVEWRVALERDGKVLATLEIARNQVRWREPGVPAATGAPPGMALEALRDALRAAVAPPAPAPAPPTAPGQTSAPAPAAPATESTPAPQGAPESPASSTPHEAPHKP